MQTPKVSIVILNWNNFKDTKECLESLEKITYPNCEVIVVDNGSKDGSTKKIEKEFPQHIYIYNNDNLGFTGGTNIGIKHALKRGADYIFFLNNDMIVDKNFLEPLVKAMADEKTGIVGSATYRYSQREKLHAATQSINYWKGGAKELGLPKKNREIDSVGDCFLIKKEVMDKIGLFYEPYFFYLADTEYCLRAKKAGFKVACEPKSKIWHKIRTTMDKIPAVNTYYFYRGKLLFVKRNAPFYVKYPFYLYGSLYLILRFVEKLIKKDKIRAFSIKNALIDFWQGKFGKRSSIEGSK